MSVRGGTVYGEQFGGGIGCGLRDGAAIFNYAVEPSAANVQFLPRLSTKFSMRSYDSSSSFRKSFDLRAQGSADIVIASGSAEFSESKRIANQTNTSVVVAQHEIGIGSYVLKRGSGLELNDEAKRVLQSVGPEDFGLTYGNRFCSSMALGGRLSSNVAIKGNSESSSSRRNLTVRVKVLFVKVTKRPIDEDSRSEFESLHVTLHRRNSTTQSRERRVPIRSMVRAWEMVELIRKEAESFPIDVLSRARQRAGFEDLDAEGARAAVIGPGIHFPGQVCVAYGFDLFSSLESYRQVLRDFQSDTFAVLQARRFAALELEKLTAILEGLGTEVDEEVEKIETSEGADSDRRKLLDSVRAKLQDVELHLEEDNKVVSTGLESGVSNLNVEYFQATKLWNTLTTLSTGQQ